MADFVRMVVLAHRGLGTPSMPLRGIGTGCSGLSTRRPRESDDPCKLFRIREFRDLVREVGATDRSYGLAASVCRADLEKEVKGPSW